MALTLLAIYLLTFCCRLWLRFINLRHLQRHGCEVPTGFEGAIDAETLRRTSAYTHDHSRLSLFESIGGSVVLLGFLFGGGLGIYDRWVASLSDSFIGSGILFFMMLTFAQEVMGTPFSLYRTFCIENRYGFNTMSFRLWGTDFLKSLALSASLLVLLAGGGLALVRLSPSHWWLWVWLMFTAISLLLMYLSPYVIEPLFFTFKPITAPGLEEEIRTLVARARLKVSRVMQVDASRRSRHSNAYFTGIGRVKRIVLFDTLLTQMTPGEIVAVLAHEIGHWKKGHVWKRLLAMQGVGAVIFYLSYRLLGWDGLPGLVGLSEASFSARVVILAFVGSLLSFACAPLANRLSRKHEWEADRFAAELTAAPENMATALIKLSAENLANLHPHPLYAGWYYSHPPVVQRVRKLRESSGVGTPP